MCWTDSLDFWLVNIAAMRMERAVADLLASVRNTQQEIREKVPPVLDLSLQRVNSLSLTAPEEAECQLGSNKNRNVSSYFEETVQMENPIFKPLLFPSWPRGKASSKRFCSEAVKTEFEL